MRAEGELRLTYQGWSGWLVEPPAGAHASLCFDPAPGQRLPAGSLVLLLTHGHPEHVDGTRAHLERADRAPVDVVASPGLVEHLRRAARPEDRFHPVRDGDRARVGGWELVVFAWDHMSLVPPEPRRAVKQLYHLLSRPRGLAKIAVGGLFGPPHGPMLGYRVGREGAGEELVYLGEGLHRRTTSRVLADALGSGAPTLIAGVEPEDEEQIPELLAWHPFERFLAFEPHREWRADFGMRQIDLERLAARLRGAGLASSAAASGDTLLV